MNKDLKDYLHLYLGCEMYLPSSQSQSLNGKLVGILKMYPFDIWQIEMPDGAIVSTEEGLWNDHFGHTKPILRPLSDMTEVEKIECDKQVHKYDTGNGRSHTITDWAYRIDWLLKQGFDLFGLIESGLAIDKTKNHE